MTESNQIERSRSSRQASDSSACADEPILYNNSIACDACPIVITCPVPGTLVCIRCRHRQLQAHEGNQVIELESG